MRGYCPRCKEYRSDRDEDAWSIVWKNGYPSCERCGSFVDVEYYVEIRNCKNRRGRRKNKEREKCKHKKTAEIIRSVAFSHSKGTQFHEIRGSR